MKKLILGILTLAAILATSTAWAQGASMYNLDKVAGIATAALSRVGQVEPRLDAAEAALLVAQTDLATLKASRGASAGALRRANEALVAAQAELAELENQMAVAKASDTAGLSRLDKLLTAKPADWQYLLPTEDPITGLVRQKCPEGTTPEYVNFGANTRFECRSLIKASDLTIPAKERTMPIWLKYTAFIAGGAAVGGAGTYTVNRFGDGAGGAGDVAGGAVLGAVVGGVVCALTEL